MKTVELTIIFKNNSEMPYSSYLGVMSGKYLYLKRCQNGKTAAEDNKTYIKVKKSYTTKSNYTVENCKPHDSRLLYINSMDDSRIVTILPDNVLKRKIDSYAHKMQSIFTYGD